MESPVFDKWSSQPTVFRNAVVLQWKCEDQTVWRQASSAGHAFAVESSCHWDYTAAKLTGQRSARNLDSAGSVWRSTADVRQVCEQWVHSRPDLYTPLHVSTLLMWAQSRVTNTATLYNTQVLARYRKTSRLAPLSPVCFGTCVTLGDHSAATVGHCIIRAYDDYSPSLCVERSPRCEVKSSQISKWKITDTDTIMKVCVKGYELSEGNKASLHRGHSPGQETNTGSA